MTATKPFIVDEVSRWSALDSDPVDLGPFVTIRKTESAGKTEDTVRTLGLLVVPSLGVPIRSRPTLPDDLERRG